MPPKKNKSQGHNGFYYFMIDFKQKQGKSFNNMRDVAEAAGPHWARMNAEQRRPYDERAKSEKSKGGRMTSEGYAVDELTHKLQEELSCEQDMKNEINRIITVAAKSGHLDTEVFFIIHMNAFCHCPTTNIYLPAEIAVSCFTLRDGVQTQDVFHSMIKPGALPLGYAATALLHSNETHQIHPPLAGDDEDTTQTVFNELIQFLSSKMNGSSRMPYLYAIETKRPMIRRIFQTWCANFNYPETFIQIFSLNYMFRFLRNSVANRSVWASDTFSNRELDKDVYAYTSNIACDYHEATVTVFCSKSIVIRQVYIVCDNCCGDLNIELVPGRHIPVIAKKSAFKEVKSRSRRTTANSNSTRDYDSESVTSTKNESDFWESDSVISDITTNTNDLEQFPQLGSNGRRNHHSGFTPRDSSSQLSGSSQKSYAGVSTAGFSRRPVAFPSTATSDSYSKGSDSFSQISNCSTTTMRSTTNNLGDPSEFPILGRGRGRGRYNKN